MRLFSKNMLPILFLLIVVGLGFHFGFAQVKTEPKFLVTWQASNFVPPDYQGKVFPTSGAKVEVDFELIDNNKIANLSASKITWEVEGEKLTKFTNSKTATFIVPDNSVRSAKVYISIRDYKGKDLYKWVYVPLGSPEVVIDVPYFGLSLRQDINKIKIRPYFFNVLTPDLLSINLTVNNKAYQMPLYSENNGVFDLNLKEWESKESIFLSAEIKSRANELERVKKSINLKVL